MTDYLQITQKSFLDTNSGCWDKQIAFTVKDVSVILNVPLSTVYDLCYNGDLKAFKVGGRWRIHRKGLYEFLQKQIDNSIVL